jgi:hypothetical protein
MMCFVNREAFFKSRKGAEAQSKALFFAPLRLCVILSSVGFNRAKPHRGLPLKVHDTLYSRPTGG